jgi:YVTN family beta-propeller protein
MDSKSCFAALLSLGMVPTIAAAGQVPTSTAAPDIAISHRDRVYAAEQFSNSVSVTDPVDNKLLGEIRLGEPLPANFSPLYRGQLLVHGMGFSPDHHTLAVVSIGSNAVSFVDTATNTVKHVTYVGRSPHEAFYTPDGREVWVTVRGENYVAVLDSESYKEKMRIIVANGPGMQIFSPDGRYGYVCSSFTPELDVVLVATHTVIGRVQQPSPFCPNIAATPDGSQVWFTLKDTGKTVVFSAAPPFSILKILDTGPITNHVNIVRNSRGQFAYVTVGGLNEIQVFRTSDFSKIATVQVGKLPHGIWPSGDGSRIYVGLENDDQLIVIDTLSNQVVASVPIGQAAQAVVYVPNAVPDDAAPANLQPLGIGGESLQLAMVAPGSAGHGVKAPTSVTLFEQGLVQILEAAVTGLEPKHAYVLGLASQANGSGALEPLSAFMTNPAGAAIVNAIGPIRQVVQGPPDRSSRRYLVIAEGVPAMTGSIVQVQVGNSLARN